MTLSLPDMREIRAIRAGIGVKNDVPFGRVLKACELRNSPFVPFLPLPFVIISRAAADLATEIDEVHMRTVMYRSILFNSIADAGNYFVRCLKALDRTGPMPKCGIELNVLRRPTSLNEVMMPDHAIRG